MSDPSNDDVQKPAAEKTTETTASKKPAPSARKPPRPLVLVKQDLKDLKAEQARQAALSKPKRFTTNDTTIEKLGELLAENPNGMLISRDEIVGFIKGMDKPGHESDRAFYLEAWNASGNRFIYDRIERGTIPIESPCVSVLGGTQPGAIGHYVREAASHGSGADGLMQRFQLLVWPDQTDHWKNIDRPPDRDATQQAGAIYDRLNALNPGTIGAELDSTNTKYFLRFDPEAQELFNRWRETLEKELRSPQVECLDSHFAKYRKLVPALALLCHLVDHPEGGPVGSISLQRAIAWAEYLKAHALRVYAPALGGAGIPANLLAERILAGEVADSFTARSVYQKGWRGLDFKETAAALELLEERGWVCAIRQHAPQPQGGRPSVSYAINPKLKEIGL